MASLAARQLHPAYALAQVGDRRAKFVFATGSHAVIVYFGRLGLRGRVRVNCVAMVRVSKFLGSNINPNPDSNSALTLIDLFRQRSPSDGSGRN